MFINKRINTIPTFFTKITCFAFSIFSYSIQCQSQLQRKSWIILFNLANDSAGKSDILSAILCFYYCMSFSIQKHFFKTLKTNLNVNFDVLRHGFGFWDFLNVFDFWQIFTISLVFIFPILIALIGYYEHDQNVDMSNRRSRSHVRPKHVMKDVGRRRRAVCWPMRRTNVFGRS
jgi:hypothetical protein